MEARWPELSWETQKGDSKSRCYQIFAPDISRIEYTNEGHVYSIICPQQGVVSKLLGALNIEVPVIGQRGWVKESTSALDQTLLAADMCVVGKIWFSPALLIKKLSSFSRQYLSSSICLSHSIKLTPLWSKQTDVVMSKTPSSRSVVARQIRSRSRLLHSM